MLIGRRGFIGMMAFVVAIGTTVLGMAPGANSAAVAGPKVLLVGSFHGVRGQFSSVQAAVDAAAPATGSSSGRVTTTRPPMSRRPWRRFRPCTTTATLPVC